MRQPARVYQGVYILNSFFYFLNCSQIGTVSVIKVYICLITIFDESSNDLNMQQGTNSQAKNQ